MRVIRTDDVSRTVQVAIEPDSRRYDVVVLDGKKFYRDKYLLLLIGDEEMHESMVSQFPNLPASDLAPSIESTPGYAYKRRTAIKSEIQTGQFIVPEEKAIPHQKLDKEAGSRDITFISLDICGSTALRNEDPVAFDRAFKILLHEFGTLVGQFNGSIFKLTGDGFIAFIDHPSFTRQCDNAVDLGLSFLVMLHKSVNPCLKEAGLKPFKIRVGADHGPAEFHRQEISSTGFAQVDIASDALNRSVKIEQSCEENEFRIGRALYELVHVAWLERSKAVDFDAARLGIPKYEVYRVT